MFSVKRIFVQVVPAVDPTVVVNKGVGRKIFQREERSTEKKIAPKTEK